MVHRAVRHYNLHIKRVQCKLNGQARTFRPEEPRHLLHPVSVIMSAAYGYTTPNGDLDSSTFLPRKKMTVCNTLAFR